MNPVMNCLYDNGYDCGRTPIQEMSKEMVASNTVQGMEDESMFKKLIMIG